MTVPFYYASTVRNMKDVAQYAVYPLFKVIARSAYGNNRQANVVAAVATTGFYSAMTNIFSGIESTAFDQVARDAVQAELGLRDDEFKFSNYMDSNNRIVKHYLEQWRHTYALRQATDLLPMLPLAMEYVSKAVPGLPPNFKGPYTASKLPEDATPVEYLLHGEGLYDRAAYAGKAGYWVYETFGIPKSGFYEVYKILENKEEVKRMITADDLIGVVNRTRNDFGLEMLNEKFERNAIWPILEHMAKRINETEEFGMEEIVYLIGNGKINIFAKDKNGMELRDEKGHHIISKAAYDNAMNEIERVATIGLKGITEENRTKRLARERMGEDPIGPKETSFVERLNRKWMDTHFEVSKQFLGKRSKFSEYISPRDLGEVPVSVS